MAESVTTSLEIRADQKQWIDEKDLNLSAFMRSKIDEEMQDEK